MMPIRITLLTLLCPAIALFIAGAGLLFNVYWKYGLFAGGLLSSLFSMALLLKGRSLSGNYQRQINLCILTVNLSLWLPIISLLSPGGLNQEAIEVLIFLGCGLIALIFWILLAVRLLTEGSIRKGIILRFLNIGLSGTVIVGSLALGVQLFNFADEYADARNIDWIIALGESDTIKLQDKHFLALAMRDTYLWADELPYLMVGNDDNQVMLDANRNANDKFSGIETYQEFKDDNTNHRHQFGIRARMDGENDYRVYRVLSGSPAEAAGLKRGHLIRRMNGIPVTTHPPKRPDPSEKTLDLLLERPDGTTYAVQLTKKHFKEGQVSHARILEQGKHKIGYVVFNKFDPLAWNSLVAELKMFKKHSITDLVLDLRYNAGGDSEIVGLLGGAILGKSYDGKIALQFRANDRYKAHTVAKPILFSTHQSTSLDLTRLTVITSEESCSASEALISALRPYMEVDVVGSTTCGKPYSFRPLKYGNHVYHLISAEVSNAKGENGYFKGIEPDCRAIDDSEHDLGDPLEASLNVALSLIQYRKCSHFEGHHV